MDYSLWGGTFASGAMGGNTGAGRLPNISGQFSSSNAIYVNATGAYSVIAGTSQWVGSISFTGQNLWLDFSANRYNSIYGNSQYVIPRAKKYPFIIKYI